MYPQTMKGTADSHQVRQGLHCIPARAAKPDPELCASKAFLLYHLLVPMVGLVTEGTHLGGHSEKQLWQ